MAEDKKKAEEEIIEVAAEEIKKAEAKTSKAEKTAKSTKKESKEEIVESKKDALPAEEDSAKDKIKEDVEPEEVEEVEEIPDEAKEYIAATEGRKLLCDPETYLKSGVHIGLTYRTGNMKKFIYTVRDDRLSIFSLNSVDERLRIAAKMLANFDKEDILVVGSRAYAKRPVRKFAENTGVKYISGRFRPGTFTNPQEGNFREPKIMLVADPIADKQALREAARVGIPVIGICDSNALTRNIDLVIPLNNKGKQSISLAFWLLTKQCLIERGELKETDDAPEPLEAYTSQIRPTKRIETLIQSKKTAPTASKFNKA